MEEREKSNGKNGFAEIFRNLAKYKSKNNFSSAIKTII